MSGPKTSRYTLTPEQRRLLAEQRITEQRKAAALANIQNKSKRLLQIGNMFSVEKRVSAELNARIGNDGGFSQKIQELEQQIRQGASIVPGTDNDVSSLERVSEDASRCVARAEKIVGELSEIAAQNGKKLQTCLDAAIDRGFSASSADVETAFHGKSSGQTALTEAKDRLREQLLQMKKNSALPSVMTEELGKAITKAEEIQDAAFLKNYSALTVAPLLKRCGSFLAEYENCREEFESLYSEYISLCEIYYYTAQEYSCSAASVEALKGEIRRIKETAAEEDEQAYISESLDEVMEEMGYAVIGSREVTKKNGRHFRNELYAYGEGTAVNVTYSPDGRIAMELGGIDTSDRLPDDRETSLLCDSMERFCGDFKEIEKRLLAKGVILAERISLLPPGEEYAQIINISDYETKGEAQMLRAERRRRTAAEVKSLNMH